MRTTVLSFVLLVTPFVANAQASVEPQAVSTAPAGVGYKSVAEALEALKRIPGVQVQITKPDAWTIINEPGNKQWSFTPASHAAYPAVVRREIKIDAYDGVFSEMTALCESPKPNCDKLIEDFKVLNDQMRQSIQSRLKPSASK
jgi:hypothetical protein